MPDRPRLWTGSGIAIVEVGSQRVAERRLAYGTTAGLRRNRLRSLLVVSEVAMALVVLISAALLIESFVRLLEVKPGFNPANVLTMDIQLPNLPPSRYAGDDEQTAFFQQLMDRLKTLPGVECRRGGVAAALRRLRRYGCHPRRPGIACPMPSGRMPTTQPLHRITFVRCRFL